MDLYTKNAVQCSEITTKNYSTSFSSGILLLDKKYRDAIYSIYAYVRFADEIVDTFHQHNKGMQLQRFRDQTFDAIHSGMSTNPILHSFQFMVNRYRIDHDLIEAFLKSMEMDLSMKTFNRKQYQQYIYGSAEVVGLMCMRVFYNEAPEEYEKLKPSAQKLGEAFQKVNFLRDMKSDLQERGRVYFPGVNPQHFTEYDKAAIQQEIEQDFAQALAGIQLLKKDARLGVYVAYRYYQELFQRIVNSPVDAILQSRIRVPNRKKLFLMLQGYLMHKMNRI